MSQRDRVGRIVSCTFADNGAIAAATAMVKNTQLTAIVEDSLRTWYTASSTFAIVAPWKTVTTSTQYMETQATIWFNATSRRKPHFTNKTALAVIRHV